NGTALTARSAVSTLSFSPPPPESTSAMACLIVAPAVSRQGRNRPRQRQAARAATRDLAPAGLPAHRERGRMRGVAVLIVGEVGVVGGEEAMQLRRVVHADLLPAQAGAEGEVLYVGAGAQRDQVPVPVLETGADVRGHRPHLELAVGAAVEVPGQVER